MIRTMTTSVAAWRASREAVVHLGESDDPEDLEATELIGVPEGDVLVRVGRQLEVASR